MLFNSIAFIFVFLPIVYLVFWWLETKSSRYIWLAVTGYVFYGWWDFRFCWLMLFSTLVSYFAGVAILKRETKEEKKIPMVLAITADLLLLGFFKYYNFFASSINSISLMFGIKTLPYFHIILPIGISFYTFHTMSYVIDSYRGTIKPTRNFFEFTCYVSLFSQLVAGPIVRFRQIEDDLENIDRAGQFSKFEEGIFLFLIGLFKKVLIADSIAAIINPGFDAISLMSSGGAWLLAFGYTFQLYFDFSGYSDMAMGLGFLFGIRIPQNFNSPYKALNITDFWRRWHISLSSWLRDYLYIPLGGNRLGSARRYENLMITMLLGGLWHGAQWTFVFWGAYHGVLLILHSWSQENLPLKVPKVLSQAMTFIAVVVGWVFFRCESLAQAFNLLILMVMPQSGLLPSKSGILILLILVCAGVVWKFPNSSEMPLRRKGFANIAVTFLFALSIFRILVNENSPFLYFQF